MTRRGVALMLGLYSNSVTDSYDASDVLSFKHATALAKQELIRKRK